MAAPSMRASTHRRAHHEERADDLPATDDDVATDTLDDVAALEQTAQLALIDAVEETNG